MPLFKRFRVIKTTRPLSGWVRNIPWVVTGFALLYLLVLTLFNGYRLTPFGFETTVIRVIEFILTLGITIDALIIILFAPSSTISPRRRWLTAILAVLLLGAVIINRFVLPLLLIYQFLVVSQRLSRITLFNRLIGNLRQRSVYGLVLSFTALIAIGTLLLTFPAATVTGNGTPLIDALFTATSATCVTGLVVKDTGGYFSFFGQLVILALIQLGGLGIMTFSASVAVLLGRRLAPGERRLVSEIVETPKDINIAQVVRYIFLFTLLAEGAGCLVLFLRWLLVFPTPAQAFYQALFHAVSAFCNAGFSLFPDSLVRYQNDIIVNLSFIILIVFGGLGFAVVHEIINRQTLRQGFRQTLRNLSVHSRLVLVTSGGLITIGAAVFFFLEYDRTLANLSLGTKLLASLFHSVTSRTAGFNTTPLTNLHPATLFLTIILMFIGASPGGTGGGIKTTTFAVLLLQLRNHLLKRNEIVVGHRAVPGDTVVKATTLTVSAVIVVTTVFFFLLLTETTPFQQLLFETVSAFGTVGLSTGITAGLKTVSKLAIILLMFAGRVGPLTLAMAMATPKPHPPLAHPQARIMIG